MPDLPEDATGACTAGCGREIEGEGDMRLADRRPTRPESLTPIFGLWLWGVGDGVGVGWDRVLSSAEPQTKS